MIPTPILTVLSIFQKNGVQALLMGGQACVFYGAAQVSKDIDFTALAEPANIERLRAALAELDAERIAVPPFDLVFLNRGHAIHFRCRAPAVAGLRVDLISKPRGVDSFERLWQRRTVFGDEEGNEFNLLSVPDLVLSKKTAQLRDWPVIELLVNIHIHENLATARPEWVDFWFRECRTASQLILLAARFPSECRALIPGRPLLRAAPASDQSSLEVDLEAEMRAEQEKDRIYWQPLRRELEALRFEEARRKRASG